jgi:K+-sensing histidine kinase KdpD
MVASVRPTRIKAASRSSADRKETIKNTGGAAMHGPTVRPGGKMHAVADRHLPSLPTGLAAGALGAGVAVIALLPLRDDVSQATPALVLVLPGVVAALLGGRRAAALVATGAGLAFGVLFLPPYGQWKVLDGEDVTALVVFLVVALAVAELTAREAQRRRTAEQRGDDLARLGRTLADSLAAQERMAEDLTRLAVMEQVDQQRSALLRSVSHDLRTPLATIRAVSSDLLSDADYDDATRAELLGLLSDEAERLDRLVGNLLSMSRIEAGAFAPDRQAVVLAELVGACVERSARLVQDRRIEVDVPPELPLIDGDYTQLDLVITNLLENAVRHSPPRSIIRVGARTRDDRVEIWVENRGEGVLPTERSRVFEAFHRSHGSRSSGVGLAICKAVVEAHGGTIGVTDAMGGGARFTFTMPTVAASPEVDG